MSPAEHRIARHVGLQEELERLARDDRREYVAVRNAELKLASSGLQLGYPWTSAVRGPGGSGLRELRPRAGRSRVRVLYARRSGVTILLALAPEGGGDARGFQRAVRTAQQRLSAISNEEEST